MIFLCKVLLTRGQESNVHYYLFSHERGSLTVEHRRLLLVIISIIVEQIKHLRVIRTIAGECLRVRRVVDIHTVAVLICIV